MLEYIVDIGKENKSVEIYYQIFGKE